MRKIALFALLALTLGCAKDRDADDYRNEKLAEELAKIDQVAGTYRGSVQGRDQLLVGAISIDLRSGTQVGGRRDGYESERYPVLRGTIVYEGKAVTFNDAFYNSKNGSFQADLNIKNASGDETRIHFNGAFAGEKLEGIIVADGDTEGSFSLTRNGVLPTTEQLRNGKSKIKRLERTRFVGKTAAGAVYLDIDGMGVTTERRFANLFTRTRIVNVTYKAYEGFNVNFPNSQWDERGQGSLLGRSSSVDRDTLISCTPSEAQLRCEIGPNQFTGEMELIDFQEMGR